jgi:hypothetical protein
MNERTMQHYDALVVESQRTGWPERFPTDLTTHDQAKLSTRDAREAFAWVLARDATYLVYPSRRPIDGAGHYAYEMPRSCKSAFGADNCRWYWWDGANLLEVGSAEALSERLEEAGRRGAR